MIRHLFSINGEGGPLLITDADYARQWRGASQTAYDYRELCKVFDSNPRLEGTPFPVGSGKGVAWEMAGAGTADVFLHPGGNVMIVRAWLDEDTPEALQELAEAPRMKEVELGHLEVRSQSLAILWAAESGEGITHQSEGEFREVSEHSSMEGG